MVNGAGSVAEILCSLELLDSPQQLLGTAGPKERKQKRVRTRGYWRGAEAACRSQAASGLKMTFINGFRTELRPSVRNRFVPSFFAALRD